MKNIKDLENMGIDALEAIADDKGTDVPADMRDRILGITAAGAFIEENRTAGEHSGAGEKSGIKKHFGFGNHMARLFRSAPYIGFAVAAACLMIFFAVPKEPADTFDDPAMAAAELERAFSYISSKMDNGIRIAKAAEPVFEKTSAAFNATGKKK